MARDSERQNESASRRKFLMASGAAGVAAVAGCSGQSGDGGSTEASSGSNEETSNDEASSGETETQSESSMSSGPLTADGSSTVYPITSDGASTWNSNPPADDKEYWGPGQYDIDTDEPLADYWAGLYGFDAGAEGQPPFFVNVGLSHSGTGVTKVMKGQVDIGDASAPVQDELPERDSYDDFINHVVGVDGQPIVVSRNVKDNGVEGLTGDQLRGIYKGDITNWSEVGGPDLEIQALGRAEGSGTDTSFRANLYGNPEESMPGIDARYGQNQQLETAIANSNNAIGYIALAFVEPDGAVPPISLELEGTTYEYGKNLGAKGYPLSRDLHCYTWQGTSNKEAAFLNMLLDEFGQTNFVETNDYFKLPPERLEEERAKLPEPSN